jgi:hypothetical protein
LSPKWEFANSIRSFALPRTLPKKIWRCAPPLGLIAAPLAAIAAIHPLGYLQKAIAAFDLMDAIE